VWDEAPADAMSREGPPPANIIGSSDVERALARAGCLLDGLRRRYGAVLLALLVLGFLARSLAWVEPTYSLDGYPESLTDERTEYGTQLQEGRYGMAMLWWLRAKIQFYGVPAASSGAALSTLFLALAALLFAVALVRRPSRAELFLLGVLFVLHPYLTEFFHFAGITLNITFAILLSAMAMAAATKISARTVAIAVGSVATAASLSIYQTVAGYLGAAFFLAGVWRLASAAESGDPPLASLAPLLRTLVALVGGVLLYLFGLVVVQSFSGVPLYARGDVTRFTVARHAAKGLSLALWPQPELIHPVPSAILILALLWSSAIIIALVASRRRFWSAALVAAGLGAAIVWASGAAALTGAIMIPREVVPAALAFGAIIMIGWRFGRTWTRLGLSAAVALLCLSYVGASNHILYDSRRVNQWDAAQVNRMIGRLEADSGFGKVETVVMIGGDRRRPFALPTAVGDMNMSALAFDWSKQGVLEQSTGYMFRDPTPAEQRSAETFCTTAPAWPAVGSAHVDGPLATICLPKDRV
jgi:hypothetical protein